MPNWISEDVEVNGEKFHYTRTGGDKHPLVLAHGFSDNGLCWTPVAQALENDYDLIMVDARGHGLSAAPKPSYSHAADLAGVIQALGLQKPGVMGHSMGALTAGLLAMQYPDLVSYIILEDPPIFEEVSNEPEVADQEIAQEDSGPAWLLRLVGKSRDELMAIARAENPGWSEGEVGPWADSKMQFNLDTLKTEPGPFPKSWKDAARAAMCPVLLIIGDVAKGGLVSPEVAQQFIEIAPNGKVAHIPGAGHSIRRDQFDAFIRAVRDFLSEQR
jgi:N-formylmaleamate deformylase